MRLQLNQGLDFQKVRNRTIEKYEQDGKPFEEFLINRLIHYNSNYERMQYSLWNKDKKEVIKQMTSLLVEISYLDRELTWTCIRILEKYKNLYELKHQTSLYVNTSDDFTMSFQQVA